MRAVLLVLAACLCVAAAQSLGVASFHAEVLALGSTDPSAAFDRWTQFYRKSYSSPSERATRLSAFLQNLALVQKHAARNDASFTIGLNAHADLTTDEFRTVYFGENPKDMHDIRAAQDAENKHERPFRKEWPYADTVPPTSIDWEAAGLLGPIKNQHVNGSPCGCCFAFGGIAGVETAATLYTGEVVPLAEQQIVSCDGFDWGCEGGAFDSVYRYVIENGGVDTEADWPYLARETACPRRKERKNRAVTIDYIVDVPVKSEEALQKTIAHRPASVGVCCGEHLDLWHLYTGGVFDESAQCVKPIDHSVLVVGYGTTEDGVDFWKIRNSWGTEWGDRGYMYVKRNISDPAGQNGVSTYPGYPVKTSPNPPAPVPVWKRAEALLGSA